MAAPNTSLNCEQIDLRVGEAKLIRDVTTKIYDLNNLAIDMYPSDWEYQSYGYLPLVRFLENKHGAPIVITNGALQALHASMYVLKQNGFNTVGIKRPYWVRIPEIIKHNGLNVSAFDGQILSNEDHKKNDSLLITMPNNPDGYLPSHGAMRVVSSMMKEKKKPLIHDAVYYTRTYLPVDYPIENLGDLQIFSASKSYGLSSLRVGYIVVHNINYYSNLLDYMELSTMGASVFSQKVLLKMLQRDEEMPSIKDTFEKTSREELKKAKQIFKTIDPERVTLCDNFENSCGMFAWVKTKDPELFSRNNIQVLSGDSFGMKDYFRINLAIGNDLLNMAVKRINNYVY